MTDAELREAKLWGLRQAIQFAIELVTAPYISADLSYEDGYVAALKEMTMLLEACANEMGSQE